MIDKPLTRVMVTLVQITTHYKHTGKHDTAHRSIVELWQVLTPLIIQNPLRYSDADETPLKESVEKLQASLAPYTDLWQTAFDWGRDYAFWMFTPLYDIDVEAIERYVRQSI